MIFVTGGTGLVGAHLLYNLISEDRTVTALKRKTSNLNTVKKVFKYCGDEKLQLFDKIIWVDGEVLDYDSLELYLKGVDEVYHCAATVSFNPKERKKMLDININGTANMINASLEQKIKKFCHVSSIAALGRSDNQSAVTEQTNWVPSKKESGYAHSKFFSENEVWRGAAQGLEIVIVNPSVIIGVGNWNSSSGQFFSTAWKGLKFYTKGKTGFVGVKDVAKAMVLLMNDNNFQKVKNQRFLLNSENISYKDFFSQIADALGKPRPNKVAHAWMLNVAYRIAKLWSFISRKEPLLTKEAASAANNVQLYDGTKIVNTIGFEYTPINMVIKEAANQFITDHS